MIAFTVTASFDLFAGIDAVKKISRTGHPVAAIHFGLVDSHIRLMQQIGCRGGISRKTSNPQTHRRLERGLAGRYIKTAGLNRNPNRFGNLKSLFLIRIGQENGKFFPTKAANDVFATHRVGNNFAYPN